MSQDLSEDLDAFADLHHENETLRSKLDQKQVEIHGRTLANDIKGPRLVAKGRTRDSEAKTADPPAGNRPRADGPRSHTTLQSSDHLKIN